MQRISWTPCRCVRVIKSKCTSEGMRELWWCVCSSLHMLYVRVGFALREKKQASSLSISIFRANSLCQALFQVLGNNSKQKIMFQLSKSLHPSEV